MGIARKLTSEITPDQRRELARHVANLFFTAERDGIAKMQAEDFAEIFLRMLDDLDIDLKTKLSSHLSRSGDASLPLLRKMAQAEAPVAEPVLEHSPLLTEDDLLDASEHLTTQHRLAVSRRTEGLTARITDSLISFGEAPVLRSVTENRTAEISESGFMSLAEHALDDDELLNRLATRIDMPPACAMKIRSRLSGEARTKLAALATDDAALGTFVAKAKSEEARQKLSVRQQKLEAKVLAKAVLDGTRSLEDVTMLLCLSKRPHALAVVFAERTKLPESKCAHAFFEVKGELLAFLCRALELSLASYKLCDQMRRDLLHLPSGDAEKIQVSYAAIDPTEARKTLHLVSVILHVS